MRLLTIGLAAAALAVLSPAMASAADQKVDQKAEAKAHAQGMADIPPLLQQTGVVCTPSDANFVGQGSNKDAAGKAVTEKIYEVACQEGLGYMILAPQGEAPQAYDCFAMTANKPKPGEKDAGKLYCKMTQNTEPLTGLAAVAAKAGVNCQVNQALYVGSSTEAKIDEYEIGCTSGAAYVLQYPRQGSSQPLNASDCMHTDNACKLQPKDRFLAALTAMAAPAKRNCQVTDGRWIGTLQGDKSNYFEIACSDPTAGYVLQVDSKGGYMSSTDCARASAIGNGCTLTTAGAAQTAEIATYQRLAKEIGYACTVNAYHSFGTESKAGREVVELACSDHPDGAITLMPTDKGQTGAYFNCARGEMVGQKCALTNAAATAAKISTEVAGKGGSCNVGSYRWVGVAQGGTDFVEVTCTGKTGMMLEYAPANGPETLKTVMSCADAKGIGGGCTLK
jgi:hypothetical protein